MAGTMKTLAFTWTVVYSNNVVTITHPITGWMRACDFKKVRGTLEIIGLLANLEISLGYQTADVENDPGTVGTIGAYKTTDDVHYPTGWTDISTAMEGKQLVRIVLLAKNASGTAVNFARVCGSVDVITE